MANIIKIKRGLSSNLSKANLQEGEIAFTTDTKKLYVSNTDEPINNDTTYKISKSGSTITLTGSDGSTTSVTDSDTNTTYSAATTSANGLMTSAMVTKLNGIAEGANAYSLPTASASTLGGIKVGTNLTISSGVLSAKDTTYSAATTSAAGLMSAADKIKLDGIAEGANKYTYTLPTASSTLGGVKTTSTVTSTSGLTACPIISGVPYYKDTNTTYTLPNATSSTLGGVKIGSNITVSSGTISLTKANVTAALGYTPPTTNTTYSTMTGATSSAAGASGLVPAPAAGKNTSFLRGDGTWVVPTNTTYSAATTSAAGLMSAADKTKLDGIATGATANSASSTTPKANGTAAVGSETTFARGDHVHPSQTTISGNAGSATYAKRLYSPSISTVNGTTYTIDTYLTLIKNTLPLATQGRYSWTHSWSYASHGLLEATIGSTTYKIQLAGAQCEFTGIYNSSYVFRITTATTSGTSGASYVTGATYQYSYRGSSYSPTWTMDNAIIGLSVSGKTITYTKNNGTTGTITTQDTNTDTKVTNTLATTTKAYVTGTTSATTNTGTQVFDTGVYLDTTAGKLTAGSFSGNGASLTSLNASNISSGTLAAARLATSGATAGSYGPSANVTGTNGTTLSVPYITVDTYGRVTSISNKTYTSKDTNTTYSAATTSANGLMSSSDKTKLNGIATGAQVNNVVVSTSTPTASTAEVWINPDGQMTNSLSPHIGKHIRVYNSSSTSMENKTTVTMKMDTVYMNTTGGLLTLSNNGIKIGAGVSKVIVSMRWTAWGSFSHYIYGYVNDTQWSFKQTAGSGGTCQDTVFMDVAEGDIIYMKAYQDSGSTVTNSANLHQTYLDVMILG